MEEKVQTDGHTGCKVMEEKVQRDGHTGCKVMVEKVQKVDGVMLSIDRLQCTVSTCRAGRLRKHLSNRCVN
jgi:hypothetical protein